MTIISIIIHIPSIAHSELKLIPLGSRVKILDEELQCFNFEEYKKLLGIDNDCFSCKKTNSLITEVNEELNLQVSSLESVVSSQGNMLNLVKKENKDLFSRLIETNKKMHEAQEKPAFANPWLLGSTVFLGLTSVFLLGWTLK